MGTVVNNYQVYCTANSCGALDYWNLNVYLNGRDVSSEQTQSLRKEVGRWLATLRQEAGLSQRDLAKAVGSDFYTFISQIENGKGRIPPSKYASWADAVQVDRTRFVKTLLSYYDPITYNILYDNVTD